MRTKYVKLAPNEQTDSNKYNVIFNGIGEDIADLYSLGFKLKSDVETQNLALPAQLAGFQAQLTSLKDEIDSLVADTGDTITMYDQTKVVFPESVATSNRCSYLQLYGEASLPIASTVVEFHQIDPLTGKRIVNPGIDRYVKSFLTNNKFKPRIDELYENSPVNVIEQESSIPHVVRARTRNVEIDNLSLVYDIEMEQPRIINSITIHPIPELLSNYEDITLITSSGASQKLKSVLDLPLAFPLSSARKRIFRFAPVNTSSLSILINSGAYNTIDNQGTKEFILGCSYVSIENVTYMNEGYIGIAVDVPDGITKLGRVIPIIEGVNEKVEVSVYENLDDFDNITDSYIITGNAEAITYLLDRTLSTGVTKIYILFRLIKQDNDTTPVVKGCVIRWV